MNDGTKDTLKQLAFHLRGLADAIDQLGGEQKTESPVENPALDDVVPWSAYPFRLQRIGLILVGKPLKSNSVFGFIDRGELDSVGTFRKLLTIGRSKAISESGVDEEVMRDIDDEFAARNCPEWLTS